MNKAEILERFVCKAGFADPAGAADMVRRYKASPDARALTFGEWAVMTGIFTPDQARVILDFFDNSRFQCLECGANVYGHEIDEPLAMACPHCGSREFQLRGTARALDATTHLGRKPTRARAPSPDGAASASASASASSSGASESQMLAISELIDQAEVSETQTISRAPKLPGSGEAHAGVRVVDGAPSQAEAERVRRPVPLEALHVLKGRSLDEFLSDLPSYALREWRAALTLIAGLNRRDLAGVALDNGRQRLAELATLSLWTRSLPSLGPAVQTFVFELVQETASALAGLGAFLAHQDAELERALVILGSASTGHRLREAKQVVRDKAAAEVTSLLAFFLADDTPLRTLSRLQLQHAAAPEESNPIETFLASPEPFVRALVAYSAADVGSPIAPAMLEARIQVESAPFVVATLQAALDRRHGVPAPRLSAFERVLILKRTPLFASLGRDNLINVAGVATERRASAGDVIFLQDTPGDAAYILVDGEVDVVRCDADGNERELARLSAPQLFGEMAILH